MLLTKFCKQTSTQPNVWHVNSTGVPSVRHLTTERFSLNPFHLDAVLIMIQACHFLRFVLNEIYRKRREKLIVHLQSVFNSLEERYHLSTRLAQGI